MRCVALRWEVGAGRESRVEERNREERVRQRRPAIYCMEGNNSLHPTRMEEDVYEVTGKWVGDDMDEADRQESIVERRLGA